MAPWTGTNPVGEVSRTVPPTRPKATGGITRVEDRLGETGFDVSHAETIAAASRAGASHRMSPSSRTINGSVYWMSAKRRQLL
jgi:hypothetical protein